MPAILHQFLCRATSTEEKLTRMTPIGIQVVMCWAPEVTRWCHPNMSQLRVLQRTDAWFVFLKHFKTNKQQTGKPGCCFLSLSDIPGRIHGSEFSESRNKKQSEAHGKCSEHGIQAAQLFMLSHCSQSAAVHLNCGRHRYQS